MIGVRPPAENPQLGAVEAVETIADVLIRNRRIIEQTRASLVELRLQKSRMYDTVISMRNQVELSRTLRAGSGAGRRSALKRSLSHSEIRVLKEVAAGLANKQVAIRLGLSQRTVRNHMTDIFAKLGVRNRTEAVLKALRLGLFTA